MTKHTQGTWFNNGPAEIHTKDAWQQPIAIVFDRSNKAGSVSKEEAQANARLIAAAPELLGALEQLADCAGITALPGFKCELDNAMNQARAIINKAKGV